MLTEEAEEALNAIDRKHRRLYFKEMKHAK